MLVATLACGESAANRQAGGLAQRAVETLGERDGYLFVFSPFNCTLRQRQIEALNALAARGRRSGRILTVGHELADSGVAGRAVAGLGIRMNSRPLLASPLRASAELEALGMPLAIAIRGGAVIAVLSGEDLQRVDSWLAWLEHRSRSSADPITEE